MNDRKTETIHHTDPTTPSPRVALEEMVALDALMEKWEQRADDFMERGRMNRAAWLRMAVGEVRRTLRQPDPSAVLVEHPFEATGRPCSCGSCGYPCHGRTPTDEWHADPSCQHSPGVATLDPADEPSEREKRRLATMTGHGPNPSALASLATPESPRAARLDVEAHRFNIDWRAQLVTCSCGWTDDDDENNSIASGEAVNRHLAAARATATDGPGVGVCEGCGCRFAPGDALTSPVEGGVWHTDCFEPAARPIPPATAPVSVERCVECGQDVANWMHTGMAMVDHEYWDRIHTFQPPPTPVGAADVSALDEWVADLLQYTDQLARAAKADQYNVHENVDVRIQSIIAAAEHRARASVGVSDEYRAAAVAIRIHHESHWPKGRCWMDGQPWPCKTVGAYDRALADLTISLAALPPTSDPEAGA